MDDQEPDFKVGDLVCGCDCYHHLVAKIDIPNDLVVMADGMHCSYYHCGLETAKSDGSCHSAYV